MKRYRIAYVIYILLLIIPSFAYSQDSIDTKLSHKMYKYDAGDSVAAHMVLPDVDVWPIDNFKSRKARENFYKLKRDILKTLPYAKYAKYRFYKLKQQLDTVKSKEQAKKLIKECEREILKDFEPDLKKMTINQGRILLKLLDRETGRSGYEILDEFKNRLSVVFWQGVARVFGYNLKMSYDPKENKEDKLIEDIIVSIGDPDDPRVAYQIYLDYMQYYNLLMDKNASEWDDKGIK